jgi:hypothetical protein
VRSRYRFGSNNRNRSDNCALLGSEKRHDLACFALKRNSKNLKQKRMGDKQNEAKKFEGKPKRTKKLLNQEKI